MNLDEVNDLATELVHMIYNNEDIPKELQLIAIQHINASDAPHSRP